MAIEIDIANYNLYLIPSPKKIKVKYYSQLRASEGHRAPAKTSKIRRRRLACRPALPQPSQPSFCSSRGGVKFQRKFKKEVWTSFRGLGRAGLSASPPALFFISEEGGTPQKNFQGGVKRATEGPTTRMNKG